MFAIAKYVKGHKDTKKHPDLECFFTIILYLLRYSAVLLLLFVLDFLRIFLL
jgi:hypothetical protein